MFPKSLRDSQGKAPVALELDLILDAVVTEISRRMPADGFTAQADVKGVCLGLLLTGHARLEEESFTDFGNFNGELLSVFFTHDPVAQGAHLRIHGYPPLSHEI
jgi:hypothetical protein